jgi:glycerol-3-phosphate cytidylyltransferase
MPSQGLSTGRGIGRSNARTGLWVTASCFDLLHAGHVTMLKEAKSKCDYLICCLQVDPSIDRKEKNKPIQSLVERYIQLNAVKYVDEIIPYCSEMDLMEILTTHQIHVRFIGQEYKQKKFTGSELAIPIHYTSRQHSFSSSELRQRILA